jgi:hypothetical protein
MSRRGSERHGGLESLVGVVDCVQRRWGGSAGGDTAVMSFGLMKRSSICCEIKQTKDVRGGTGASGGE